MRSDLSITAPEVPSEKILEIKSSENNRAKVEISGQFAVPSIDLHQITVASEAVAEVIPVPVK